ncbi:unnamed protein product [Cochlearia groenlandica]
MLSRENQQRAHRLSPVVTFRFSGGAELAMEAASMFYTFPESDSYENAFCMSVRPATDHGIRYKDFTAIGLMAQQYYNVAYDLLRGSAYSYRAVTQEANPKDLFQKLKQNVS